MQQYLNDTSLGATPAPRRLDAGRATIRWFVPAWTMLPLATRRCLVRNPHNGASAELSAGEYAVLSACEGCRTLAEHEARAVHQVSAPPEHRAAIRELLERCARQGLLMALPDLVARFGPPGEERAPPVARIAVPTADRPEFLSRLLTGASRLQQRTGVAYPWHVFDDSRSEESRRANREVVATCPALDVTYHDLSGADSLQAALIAAFPELCDEIRSLLEPARGAEITGGRCNNCLLLRLAGQRLLHLDDDALVEPRRPPLSEPGIEVSSGAEAAYWYGTFDAAFAACPELALDPFAEHARWLGLPLATAWRRAQGEPGGLRITSIPPPFGSHFAPDARVIFTGNHVLGDPGWATFSGLQLTVGRETQQWLAEHPEAARYAFESQIHWRGRPALHLAPQVVLSTTTLAGIDNTVLIPPALRAGRAVDTQIGEITRCIHLTGWHAILPFALPHVRSSRRQWLTPADAYVMPPDALLVSYARWRSASIRAEDPAERLATLGSMFVDLGGASDATVIGLLEEQAADHASRILFSMHEQLDDASVQEAWKDTLREWLASPLLRIDAVSLRKHVVSLDTVRTVARDYGRALIAWPRLWAYCRERFQ
jgi:hypothetical protein